MSRTLRERLLGRIAVDLDGPRPVDDAPCWNWTGAITGVGYGQIVADGKKRSTHRLMYERTFGPIAPGLQIDHLCRNRACCNPAHLEAVTNQENTLRGECGQVNRERQLAKTACPNGHEWTPENTLIRTRDDRSFRCCRACARERARRAREAGTAQPSTYSRERYMRIMADPDKAAERRARARAAAAKYRARKKQA